MSDKVLWGLCYKNDDDDTLAWVLNHWGMPIFSEHISLVLAHGVAMAQNNRVPYLWFAAQVGPNGHPRAPLERIQPNVRGGES